VASVVKDDGSLQNNVGLKVIDEYICQRAALSANDSRLMIGEMANMYAKDGIEKWRWVTLIPRLLSAFDDPAGFMACNIIGSDIVKHTKWMHHANHHYHIDHDSDKM